MKKITIILAALLTLCTTSWAAVEDDLDSLGGNKEIIKKAKEMDPKNKVRIVQNRDVDRTWRVELSAAYGLVSGGDPYLNSDNLGAHLDLHITPRWSVGARYYSTSNKLTQEGERRMQANESFDTDAVQESYLAVINFYPIYGKLNLFDWTVAQFDLYALAGYGQMQLSKGSSDTYTVGGGIGVWLNQHLSTRFEARYQNYTDQVYSGERQLDTTILTMSLGLLL